MLTKATSVPSDLECCDVPTTKNTVLGPHQVALISEQLKFNFVNCRTFENLSLDKGTARQTLITVGQGVSPQLANIG